MTSGVHETKDGDRNKFYKISPTDKQDRFDIFDKWLVTNGAKFEKVKLKDYGDEVRGCHSTTSIRTGKIFRTKR